MSEEPGSPTLEEREAELAQKEKEINDQLAELRQDREDRDKLNTTLDTIAERLSPQQAPRPEPEPLPTEEDFEDSRVASSARVAGRVMREGLTQYHNVVGSEIEHLKEGQKEWELEKLQREDPISYELVEKDMREESKKYNYSPGLMRRIFNLKRGERMDEIQKVKNDRAAANLALSEPIAEPNMMGGSKHSKEPKYDMLTQNQIGAIRGLGVNPKEYFLAKTGRAPEFEEGYLKSLGLPDEEVGSDAN